MASKIARLLTAFEAVETECWSVKCVSYSNGDAGDADVGWEVVSHHMAKPHERLEGQGSTPLAAIEDAVNQQPAHKDE